MSTTSNRADQNEFSSLDAELQNVTGTLTTDLVEGMTRYLNLARGEQPWPFRHPGASSLQDRILRCRQDPAFGWHFVGALDTLGLQLPDHLEQDSVRRAWWWRRYGADSPELEMARALHHPALSRTSAILEALLLCQDATPGEIAGWLDVAIETIQLYADLFFNVRTRGSDLPYVTAQVYPDTRLIRHWNENNNSEDFRLALREAAWESGADEVRFMAGLNARRHSGNGPAAHVATRFGRRLMRQAEIAARQGGHNSSQLLHEAARMATRRNIESLIPGRSSGEDENGSGLGRSILNELQKSANIWNEPGDPDWVTPVPRVATEISDTMQPPHESWNCRMDAKTLRRMAIYLDEARGGHSWPFQHSNAQDRHARIDLCLADPAFGWHFVRASDSLGIPLPDDLHQNSVRRAFNWLRHGVEDELFERAYAFSHPAVQCLTRLLNAFLMCRDLEHDDIAERLCQPVESIQIYSDLFFNVRDRRSEPLYLARLVFPQTRLAELNDDEQESDIAVTLLRAAYESGVKEVSMLAGLVCGAEENEGLADAGSDYAVNLMTQAMTTLRYGRSSQTSLFKEANRMIGFLPPTIKPPNDPLAAIGDRIRQDLIDEAQNIPRRTDRSDRTDGDG